MPRIRFLAVFGLLTALAVAVGCGKKPRPAPEPEVKVENPQAPPEKEKTEPRPKPVAPPNPKPNPKSKSNPNPEPSPKSSSEQPDATHWAYNKINAKIQLMKISFAMAIYENLKSHYPAGIVGPDGNLGLSWRVAILPYLDDKYARLYKEFKLTEAWDSPHNKKLLAKMPAEFATPGTAANEGRTHYRVFGGPNAFLPLPKQMPKEMNLATHWGAQSGQVARGRTSAAITDGRANTFMVVQANEPVEWTKPDYLVVTDESVPKLGLFQKEFFALMCDGAVYEFPESVTEESLRALVSTNAGDLPGLDTGIRFTPPAKIKPPKK